jgi:DNA-binding MurR/RpiR family transcriptional regulator
MQRRIAQFIASNLGEVVFLSGGDLAQRVGASQPSVTRFATSLGFEGYPALRRYLQEHYLRQLPEGQSGSVKESATNKYQDGIRTEIHNLELLADSLGEADELTEVGRGLAEAAPLVVLGLRAASPVATYFAYFASKCRPDIQLIVEGGSRLYDRLAESKGSSARLVCFALPRYPQETVEGIRFAKAIGMEVVVVADDPLAPVVELADTALSARVSTRTLFDSHAAPMVLANLLVQAMCDADPKRTEKRLEEFDKLAAERHYFYADETAYFLG